MTKYKMHKKTNKRNQRGGGWFDSWPFTSSNGDQVYGDQNSYSNQASALGSQASQNVSAMGAEVSEKAGKAKSYFESFFKSSPAPSYTPIPASATPTTRPDTTVLATGGRKRRKMRGGKGGLGLTYYATPVLESNVVKPNEWLPYKINYKGGSRKRRCKTRKCNTRKCKTRKHKTRKR